MTSLRMICLSTVIAQTLIHLVHIFMRVLSTNIRMFKKRSATKGLDVLAEQWTCVTLHTGAALYFKKSANHVECVRMLFPGARQAAADVVCGPLIQSMEALKDGVVAILGRCGFDYNARDPMTYLSAVSTQADSRAAIEFCSHTWPTCPIDAVGYSLGCGDVWSVSSKCRGILLVAPILPCMDNSSFARWAVQSRRMLLNSTLLVLYRVFMPWLVGSFDDGDAYSDETGERDSAEVRIAVGSRDVFGWIFAPSLVTHLPGGHNKCMYHVTPSMCDFRSMSGCTSTRPLP